MATESELNPEWQIRYASILCELQSYYKCKIVITTHSTYLMTAVEEYVKKRGIRTSFFKAYTKDGYSTIKDCTDTIYEIYEDFAAQSTLIQEIGDKH